MSKYSSTFIFILCAVFLTASAFEVPAQETDIETIIKEASTDRQKGAVFGYTYFMKFSFNQHRKFGVGKKFTRQYEAILPTKFSLKKTYSHPLLVIKDSDRVITAEEIAHMRNELAKELERAESEAAKNPDEVPEKNDGGYWKMNFSTNGKSLKIDVLHLLNSSKFSNLQRKQIDGRNVILIDFAPDPAAKLENPVSYLSKIEGQIWIDEADKRVFRIEGFPLGKLALLKDKTDAERLQQIIYLFAQTRVEEGFWFPKEVVLDFSKNPDIFNTIRIEFSFTDYKKSSVEVESYDVKSATEGETDEKLN